MKLDQRLWWKEHIDHIKTKCTKSLDLIKCLSKTRWGSDRDMLMRLYRSLIRSKIDYACFVYWTASNHIIKKLDAVHNSAIRLALGAFRSSPVLSMHAESGELRLSDRRNQLALQFYARCLQSPQFFTYNITVCQHQKINLSAVSYTHLTLPTKRIV